MDGKPKLPRPVRFLLGAVLGCIPVALLSLPIHLSALSGLAAEGPGEPREGSYDWQLPDPRVQQPFRMEQPIYFVSREQAHEEWDRLPAFWNEGGETARDPHTGQEVRRRVVRIKVPLGLDQGPPVPAENPLTVARWALGKRLFFDPVLSSDNRVACATCHDPKKGFTDRQPVATGIHNLKGSVSAPPIFNAAYSPRLFWDGRASSLEDQAQGPVQNALEMFDGRGDAWARVVERVRRKEDYRERFREAFGTEPTRDAVAKAIACYERTVLCGNSIHDRAKEAMRRRVPEGKRNDMTIRATDYELVLWQAVIQNDLPALTALGLDPDRDREEVPGWAARLDRGRKLFFETQACHHCHDGGPFTDHKFHNIGIGVKDGLIPPEAEGRFARLPVGHKNADLRGAFKTPTLRGLLGTAPYMHDGRFKTLEQVVEYYDRGGNASESLDHMMRDLKVEYFYERTPGQTLAGGPEVRRFGTGRKVIVPLRLGLTEEDKKALVLFLKALQGDPIDPVVADERTMPDGPAAGSR